MDTGATETGCKGAIEEIRQSVRRGGSKKSVIWGIQKMRWWLWWWLLVWL